MSVCLLSVSVLGYLLYVVHVVDSTNLLFTNLTTYEFIL